MALCGMVMTVKRLKENKHMEVLSEALSSGFRNPECSAREPQLKCKQSIVSPSIKQYFTTSVTIKY